MHDSPIRWAAPIGRLLLAGLFILSGANKLQNWDGTAQLISDKGLPAANALLAIAVGLELVGGILVALGIYARWGAVALLLFIVPVTCIMHNFWSLPAGEQRMLEMRHFMSNAALAGGLLFVLAMGAGPCSIDALRSQRPPAPNHAG